MGGSTTMENATASGVFREGAENGTRGGTDSGHG